MTVLRILSKVAGFRRGGIAHPDAAMIYPADRFTEDQLGQLRAEPKLDVIEHGGRLPDGIEIPRTGIPEADFQALLAPEAEETAKPAKAPTGTKTKT
jgi:hypothetical protein